MSLISLFHRRGTATDPVRQPPQPELSRRGTASRADVFDASETTVLRVLEALRPVQTPTVVDSIFDALEDVLGLDYVPDEDEISDLSLRMRGYLMRLVGVAPEDKDFTVLVERARALLDVEVPQDFIGIRVHLRRMALTALGLLDLLAPFSE
ncbi:DUF6415 family natural product biosynthesis protein, partial [Streptomyces sp. WM4235]|uniref:DUF6415 family natural product biosynthesis protein n=1 Tax=Streptomyces sp. WM4235 TaxID=1415551 RepID=UPI000AF9841A